MKKVIVGRGLDGVCRSRILGRHPAKFFFDVSWIASHIGATSGCDSQPRNLHVVGY